MDVILYTDGACSGNPGPGGWAAVLIWGERRKEISGYAASTTNNRMELTALLQGLAALKTPCSVQVHSDSTYVVNAFRQGWLTRWQKNGWRTSQGTAVENQDLWQAILQAMRSHDVQFHWVKGHARNTENNRCDELAREAIRRQSPAVP